jgi:hypothetical protein
MKNRFYALMFFCSALMLAQNVNAQQRYHDFVFDSVTVTTDTFSSVYGLAMDIYQPYGDSLCRRPVIVLAHGGSFISGNRSDDNAVVTMCQNFAKRGYVMVSIEYRLGNAVNMALDSSYAENEVLQAIGDGKAAVRFLRKDAYTANKYRIDTNLVSCGGNSAGAVLFMHYIYITNVNQTSPALQTIINNNGGLEGNSGNPGYSSEVNAVLSLAGGLNDPSFIVPGDKPVAHFQGDADNVVPYVCALAENGAINVRLCGLGSLNQPYITNNVIHVSKVYPGAGHVPWQSNTAEMTEVDSMSANFMDSITAWPAQIYCNGPSAVQNITADDLIAVYPNPASKGVTISFPELEPYIKVQLVDGLGRVVTEKSVTALRTTFDRNSIASGVYFIRAIKKDASTVIRKVIFE